MRGGEICGRYEYICNDGTCSMDPLCINHGGPSIGGGRRHKSRRMRGGCADGQVTCADGTCGVEIPWHTCQDHGGPLLGGRRRKSRRMRGGCGPEQFPCNDGTCSYDPLCTNHGGEAI